MTQPTQNPIANANGRSPNTRNSRKIAKFTWAGDEPTNLLQMHSSHSTPHPSNQPLVLILGAGAFGSAVALSVARAGRSSVVLLPKFQDERDALLQTRQSPWLQGSVFPPSIAIGPCYDTNSPERDELFRKARLIFWAIPTSFSAEAAGAVANVISNESIIVVCSKGLICWGNGEGSFAGNGEGSFAAPTKSEFLERGGVELAPIQHCEVLTILDVLSRLLVPVPHLCVLSGPNFAKEMALGLFSVSVIACAGGDLASAKIAAELIEHESWRIIISDDYVGVQIAGALKNVLAIAVGVLSSVVGTAANAGSKEGDKNERKMCNAGNEEVGENGRKRYNVGNEDGDEGWRKIGNVGQNARAALISFGLQEIATISDLYYKRIGCVAQRPIKSADLLGVYGVGDTVLTCCSEQSRNTTFGAELGKSGCVEAALAKQSCVVEGYYAAKQAFLLARELGAEAPIVEAVYRALYGGCEPVEAVIGAMTKHTFFRTFE